MAGPAQAVDHVVEQQIGVPHELVELVEVAAGPLDELQRLGELAGGRHQLVGGAVGTGVLGVEGLLLLGPRSRRTGGETPHPLTANGAAESEHAGPDGLGHPSVGPSARPEESACPSS